MDQLYKEFCNNQDATERSENDISKSASENLKVWGKKSEKLVLNCAICT